jgi:hypothetical protein
MKPYQKHFTLNRILAIEPLADKVIGILCQELESRFVEGENKAKTADIAAWIEYCEHNP